LSLSRSELYSSFRISSESFLWLLTVVLYSCLEDCFLNALLNFAVFSYLSWWIKSWSFFLQQLYLILFDMSAASEQIIKTVIVRSRLKKTLSAITLTSEWRTLYANPTAIWAKLMNNVHNCKSINKKSQNGYTTLSLPLTNPGELTVKIM
jgi:hypothetical protein